MSNLDKITNKIYKKLIHRPVAYIEDNKDMGYDLIKDEEQCLNIIKTELEQWIKERNTNDTN